ncbi:MAG: sensor histidine kinase [Actinomycetota bacterium]
MANDTSIDAIGLVHGLIRVSAHLSAHSSLNTRMTQLCMETTAILGCDRCSIMVWDGEYYRAAYNWGNPPDIAEQFPNYRVPAHAPLVNEMLHSVDSFVVVNNAADHPATKKVSEVARIKSLVMAAMRTPTGLPLGFMTAEFNERMGTFGQLEAEIVLGAARLAQISIVTDRERRASRRLASEFDAAIDNERRRLGRQIHDSPLQQLFALRLRLKVIEDATTDERTREALATLAADCDTALSKLRQLATETHPATSDEHNCARSLHLLLDDYAAEGGWETRFADETTVAPGPATTMALLKVAELALHNIVLHAQASTVAITMQDGDHGVELRIVDDGRGFDPDAAGSSRLGLVSMREHAGEVGGSVAIESAPSEGSTIMVRIPVSR